MKDVETKLNSPAFNRTQYNNSLISNVSMKAQGAPNNTQAVQLPDIYYNPNANYEKKSFVEKLKKFDILGLITPFFEHPVGVLGTWFALSFGMDKFNEACCGEYEKSLIAKSANFGDKIANLKPFKSETFKKGTSGIANGWNKLITKAKENSGVVRAFIDTPAKPTNPQAKSIMFNEQAELVEDLNRIFETFGICSEKETPNVMVERGMSFNNLDIRKGETAEIEKFFGKAMKDLKEEEIVNYVNLKHVGANEGEIRRILASSNCTQDTKKYILDKMGVTFDDIVKWQKEPDKYFEEAKKAAEKVRGLSVQKGNSRLTGKLFNRKLGIDGIHNKMRSITKDGGKTALGRFNAKAIQRIYRGITFGNGKLGALIFVSPMLMRAIKNTKDAGSDEKVGTAVWGLIDSFLWIITFGLSAKLLYHRAGMRNAGMKIETVEVIECIKNAFNKDFLEGNFTTKKAAIEARKEAANKIKTLRKVEGQNLLTRILRSIVTPLSKDLNMMKGVNFWQKLGYKAQNCVSVPLKFLLVMMVFDSKMRDIAKKCCNAIFGKDYDSYETEEHDKNKQVQKEFTKKDLTQRLYKLQAAKMAEENKPINSAKDNEQQENTIVPVPVKLKSEDELMQKMEKPQSLQNEILKQETQQEQQPQAQKTMEIQQEQQPKTQNKPEQHEIAKEAPEQKSEAKQNEKGMDDAQTDNTKKENIDNKQATEDTNSQPRQNNVKENKVPEQAKNDVLANTPNNQNVAKPKEKRDNYTYIPSQNNVLNNVQGANEKIRKYIPSQNIFDLTKTFDNSGLSQVLRRADRAEQMAINILSGKYQC
ncbi:MAG: hypothetical protein MJ231_01015 [bacterium]|nr:hypothetical protein [bacterium]